MARIIDAFSQFFDDNGDPLVNGLLKFYVSGTNNTDKDTFADINETIPNTNPVQLDGAGRCPNVFGTGAYNVISYTSASVQIQQFDPVSSDPSLGAFSDWNAITIYSERDIVTASDGQYYRSLAGANQNQDPLSNPGQWEEVTLNQIWNTNVTYGIGDTAYGSDGYLYLSRTSSNIGNDPTADSVNWAKPYYDSDATFTNYIAGLTLSNNVTDPAKDLDIAIGSARDSVDDITLILTTALIKQLDAAWTAGTNAGGLSSSLTPPVADTWYHVFLVEIAGAVDVLFDTSVTCANGVTDHSVTKYRRIGSILTDGSANILGFNQHGDRFVLSAPIQEFTGAWPSVSRSTLTVASPLGLKTVAILFHSMGSVAGAADYMRLSDLDTPDVAVSNINATAVTSDSANGYSAGGFAEVVTNLSSQIGYRSDSGANGDINIHGWIDKRGAN